MAQITIKTIKDKEIWEKFNKEHSPSNLLQSWNWGQFQRSMNRATRYFGIFDNENLIGICLAHKVPTKFRTHVYVPNGPIIEWERAREILPKVILKLKNFASNTGAAFVRLDPLILDNQENRALLKKYGFRKAATDIQAPNKWILDITKDPKELLADMRKNTRYAIRRSSKEGVEVKSSIDFKDFDKFWGLFKKTVERQDFIPHSKQYYTKQIKAFAPDRQYRIYWAEYENEITAAALIPFYGDTAYYLHAASSMKHRNVFAGHALIWKVIEDAKKEDISYFDFCGVAPTDDPDHPWAGFSFFKKSFGGFQQDMVATYDLPIKTLRYIALVKPLEATQDLWSGLYYKIRKYLKK